MEKRMPKVHRYVCPKCLQVLDKPPEIAVYKCDRCGATLDPDHHSSGLQPPPLHTTLPENAPAKLHSNTCEINVEKFLVNERTGIPLEQEIPTTSCIGSEKENGLYEIVSKWIDDANFSEIFGGLINPESIDLRNVTHKDVDAVERSSSDDEDKDYNYDLSDNSEHFVDSDYEFCEDDELFDKHIDPSVEFIGCNGVEREQVVVYNEKEIEGLKKSYYEVNCMNSSEQS